MLQLESSDIENSDEEQESPPTSQKPWHKDFVDWIERGEEHVPEDMEIVTWWGVCFLQAGSAILCWLIVVACW